MQCDEKRGSQSGVSGLQVLRGTWWVSVVLLLGVGGALLMLPELAGKFWPWSLAPFNTRLLGSVYLSAAIPLIAYVLRPQWAQLRITLPIFAWFTTFFLLVSMGHSDGFLARKSSHIWFWLYGADAFIGLFYCWRLRRSLWLQGGQSNDFSRLYQVQALILGGYGLGLLLLASWLGPLWLWPLNAFHAHLYSGVFLAGAIAMMRLQSGSTVSERVVFGGTQAFLGVTAALGIWLVDQQVKMLDWSTFWPWIWQLIFLGFGGIGGMILSRELLFPGLNKDT